MRRRWTRKEGRNEREYPKRMRRDSRCAPRIDATGVMDGVLIIGAGGHGRVVCDALMALGKNIAGFLDRDDRKVGGDAMGHPILNQEKTLAEIDPAKVVLANGVGDLRVRKAIHQTFTASGFRFETVIHPSVIMARDVAIEAGVQIMAGSVIQTGVRVAANALINTRSSVDHDCAIGMHAFFGTGRNIVR